MLRVVKILILPNCQVFTENTKWPLRNDELKSGSPLVAVMGIDYICSS